MNEIKPYQILLLEDNVIDQRSFKKAVITFKNKLEFIIVDSVQDAQEALETQQIDGIIADYRLRDGNCFEIIEKIKRKPFIIMTGTGDENIAAKAFKHGAFDYVIKDMDRNYIKSLPSSILKAIQMNETKDRLHLFESIIVHLTDAVMVTEYKNDILEVIYINEAFSKITNYQPEEAIGQNIYFLAGEATPENALEGIVVALVKGEIYNTEIILHKKNQEVFWASVSFVPITQDGKTLYFTIVRDITDRKKAEEKLTFAIAEAKKARLAEQQFLASMSHEIRTPMNAIVGMTHLLSDTPLTYQQEEYLNALKYSSERMMWIISDILDLSKIHAEKIEFNYEQFNLFELLIELQSAFLYKLNDRKTEVIIDLDISLSNDVIGDESRLRQILTNLLARAAERTVDEEIGIKISLLDTSDTEYQVEFQVYDKGSQLTDKELATLFESFMGEHDEIKDNLKITTLGMSISKKLIERMGGNIQVDFYENMGTTYSFVLPFGNSGVLSSIQPDKDGISNSDEEVLEELSVLVAEDNLMNQKLINGMLSMWNCHFDIVNNGKEALELFYQRHYDLILMDINMPEMDGYETSVHIRNSEDENKNIPIIALTAAVLSTEKEKVFESGMNKYITKPFNPKKLKEIVLRLIKNQKSTDYTSSIKSDIISDLDIQQSKDEPKSMLTIDLNYLKEFSGGDKGFIMEMGSMFLEQMPLESQRLEEHLQNKEWKLIGKLAHKMKPNFLMMGMEAQKSIAREIEHLCLEDEIDEIHVSDLTTQLIKDTNTCLPMVEMELKKTT